MVYIPNIRDHYEHYNHDYLMYSKEQEAPKVLIALLADPLSSWKLAMFIIYNNYSIVFHDFLEVTAILQIPPQLYLN